MASGENFLSDYSNSLIEKIANDPVYNGQKQTLGNGIEVTFIRCKGDPFTTFLLSIDSGSFWDPAGKKGLAHLYEHLAFRCRKREGGENFYEMVKDLRVSVNGGTDYNQINFSAEFTRDCLEEYLKAESWRYASVGNMITDNDIFVEVEVIINEYFNSLLSNPLTRVNEVIARTLFENDHPMFNPVIGRGEDLRSVSRDDIVNFEKENIIPGKTKIYIHGDYDEGYVFELVEKYFGRKSTCKKEIKQEIVVKQEDKTDNQLKEPRHYFIKNDLYSKGVIICYSGTGKYSRAWIEINMVLEYMVQKGITNRSRDYSVLNYGFFYLPLYEESIVDGYNGYLNKLKNFDCISISDKQLIEIKQKQLMVISDDYTVMNKLKIIAMLDNSTIRSSFRTLTDYIKEATKEHLQNILETYFINNPHTTVSLIRPGDEMLVIPGATEVLTDKTWMTPGTETSGDKPEFVISNGESPRILKKTTPIWRLNLKNGIRVFGSTMKSRGNIEGKIFILVDISAEPQGQSGINYFCAKILEGSKYHSYIKFKEVVVKLKSTIKILIAPTGIEIQFKTDRNHIKQLFELIKESVVSHGISYKSVADAKKRINQELSSKTDYTDSNSFRIFTELAFGERHPYARSLYGLSAHKKNINIYSLKKHFEKYIIPNLTKICISGEITKREIIEILSPLETEWNRKRLSRIKFVKPTPAKGGKIYLNDLKDEDGVWITAYRLTPPVSDKDNYILTHLNNFLGYYPGINLLNQNLRRKRSLAYISSSGIMNYGSKKYFYARCSTSLSKFSEAFKTFTDTIYNYPDNFTPDMFTYTKNEVIKSRASMANDISRQLSILKFAALYPYRCHPDKQRLRILQNLTRDQMVETARRYLNPTDLYIIITGDASRITPQLHQLNLTEIIKVE